MSHLDYIIIAMVLLSSLYGFSQGFIREAFSLSSWVAAFLFGIWFGPSFATEFAAYIGEERLGQIVSFLVVLVATLVAAAMIRWGLGQVITRTGLSATDRILGFAFGAVRGGLLVTIMLMVAQSLFSETGWWADSELKHNFLQFEDEVLTLVDIASDNLEDPPQAPDFNDLDLSGEPPLGTDNFDDADYFEE
jgi:membrane protein required for colicin V production